MFEQVRETGFPGFFVLGANVIPDIHGHDRRLVVFVDDQAQAVVERVFGEVDIDIGGAGTVSARGLGIFGVTSTGTSTFTQTGAAITLTGLFDGAGSYGFTSNGAATSTLSGGSLTS